MAVGAERDLYAPVKAFLEAQGYDVKAEVKGCDVVAVRPGEPPVIVELKRRFNLDLLLQGVDRMGLSDRVYLAVDGSSARGHWHKRPDGRAARKLCRLIGLGLLLVFADRPHRARVEVVLDPVPYRPRTNKRRAGRLLGEHARRAGDHNVGGSTRVKIVTAYRQEALRCCQLLLRDGNSSPRALKASGHAPNAAKILRHDYYGWFERIERGVYGLSETGRRALETYAHALDPAITERAPKPQQRNACPTQTA
ncbi:MAG: DUF2161 family putative PD-(D/E)XK-type phosphodiesterase [Alphaproteobacteria bacterium]|nr:DUF2161 family putative PD-(D/E)XK-type phosphodiesterase [Alphaproteobacteria bacterium]